VKLIAFLILVSTAFAGSDFDLLVRAIESNYGTKRLQIPFMGVANFLVKVTRPAGTKDFKLAVFEHVDDRLHPSADQLETTFQPQGWRPFVKVVSRKSGERVHIYARQSHRDHELLITTLERNEATMVQVRVDADRLARWVNDPVRMCRMESRR
jgi:hypothetical protein